MPQPHDRFSIPITRRRLLGSAGALLACLPAGHRAFESSRTTHAQSDPITVLATRPEWSDAIGAIFDAFTAKTGVGVDYEFAPISDLSNRTLQRSVAGDPPDVATFLEGPALREAVDSGLVANLSGAVLPEQIVSSGWEQLAFADGVWGAPLASYTWGIFYWKSALSRVGATVPATWDDLIDTCNLLLGDGQTPILMPAAEGYTPYFLYMLAVSSCLGIDGWRQLLTGERQLNDDRLLGAAELVASLRPFFNPDFLSLDFETGRLQFLKGLGAMTVGSSLDYTLTSNPSQVIDGTDLGFAPFPSRDGALPPATVTGLDTVFAATTHRARPEAIDLLAWLVQPEAQQIVANRLALPVNPGINSETEALSAEVNSVRQGVSDLPVWYAIPATASTFSVAQALLPTLLSSGEAEAIEAAYAFATGMEASIARYSSAS
jgi:ABC-type glycerol-3-phosphate transport system substrate-binding protein